MAESRFPCASPCSSRETVCIETNRVLDSCRDRDCFEDVRVYLSDYGCDLLERTGAIRAKCAQIVSTCITIDPIPFNRGFYSVNIRFYVKLTFEVCINGNNRTQEIDGLTVVEKRVILYGGESNVNIFKSSAVGGFCCDPDPNKGEKNVPTAIVEVVDPIVLGVKIMEKSECHCNCCCCCCEEDLPGYVVASLDAPLVFDDKDDSHRILTVSLGIFSVVRIVRPAQYLIQASECCIPEKECHPVEENDPCKIFGSIPFPVGEFCLPDAPAPIHHDHPTGKCGC